MGEWACLSLEMVDWPMQVWGYVVALVIAAEFGLSLKYLWAVVCSVQDLR